MKKIESFEDLKVWQKARCFCEKIYPILTSGSLERDFALRDQLNRASGSVMDNIAEGFERGGKNEFIQFLSYAKSSAGEVRSQLYRCLDRNHLPEKLFTELSDEIMEISRMASGLITYLKTSEYRGNKMKDRTS